MLQKFVLDVEEVEVLSLVSDALSRLKSTGGRIRESELWAVPDDLSVKRLSF